MFYLAKQEMIEIIGTYEWNQATSTFDVFDFFFFEQSHHNAKACGTPANKWYLVNNYLLEKSFCWCAESAAHFHFRIDNFPRYSQKQTSGSIL